jgi:hypothetical protein
VTHGKDQQQNGGATWQPPDEHLLRRIQNASDLLMLIQSRDFGGLPLELGRISRMLGADPFTDEEILEHVARHREGDFGEYGRFEDCTIEDRHRRGETEDLSYAQMNRLRIELRLPYEIRSRYATAKGDLYVSTFTLPQAGRSTHVYGPEGL